MDILYGTAVIYTDGHSLCGLYFQSAASVTLAGAIVRRQTAVAAHFTSEPLLLFVFAVRYGVLCRNL